MTDAAPEPVAQVPEPPDSAPSPRDELDITAFTDEERAILARVGTVLRRIEFGTVLLVVQDGKVVQIEMAEKFRLR